MRTEFSTRILGFIKNKFAIKMWALYGNSRSCVQTLLFK